MDKRSAEMVINAPAPALYIPGENEKIFTDYKTLYHRLFNEVTDCIYALQAIQQHAEDFYIAHSRRVKLPEGMKIIK